MRRHRAFCLSTVVWSKPLHDSTHGPYDASQTPDIQGMRCRLPSTTTGRSATPRAPPSRSAAPRAASGRLLRGPEARRAPSPLRPAARDGRRAQELGGAQGPVAARGGEAPRGARRGPSRSSTPTSRASFPRATTAPARSSSGTAAGTARSSPRIRGEQLARGKLEFELFGFKLRGRWTLVRMGGKDKEWLLLKKADELRRRARGRPSAIPSRCCRASRSRRCAHGGARLAAVREALGAPRRAARRCRTRARQSVMLATRERAVLRAGLALRDQVRRRARARRAATATRSTLYGRSGQDVTAPLPGGRRRAPRAAGRRASCIDGEIVALDERGRAELPAPAGAHGPHRAAPTSSARAATVPVSAVFFDCARARGPRSAALPLAERKACLALRCPPRGVVRYGDHVVEQGEAFSRRRPSSGSRASSPSARRAPTPAARTRDWLKIKCHRRQEFVIGGYTDPQGARGAFGALHLGVYDGRRASSTSSQGRHRLRRARSSRQVVGSAAAARAADVALRRGTPTGPRPSLGRAAARRRGPLHRVDARTAASAIPTFLGLRDDEAPRGLPARGRSGCLDRRRRSADARTTPWPRTLRRPRRGPATPASGREREMAAASPPDASEPSIDESVVTNLDEGVLAGRGLHEGRSRRLLRERSRRDCCPTCATGRSC